MYNCTNSRSIHVYRGCMPSLTGSRCFQNLSTLLFSITSGSMRVPTDMNRTIRMVKREVSAHHHTVRTDTLNGHQRLCLIYFSAFHGGFAPQLPFQLCNRQSKRGTVVNLGPSCKSIDSTKQVHSWVRKIAMTFSVDEFGRFVFTDLRHSAHLWWRRRPSSTIPR